MKRWKGFISGFITAMLVLGLAVPAFAAYQKQATLNYNSIKVTLDGKAVTPKDANGNTVEPFTIDGTTYLPVRAVANALGLTVGWEQATQTVKLSSEPTPNTNTDTTQATIGQKNALNSAKNYLSMMAFSYTGLIEQLEYEKYSHADAVYAADNCGANWKEQAAKSAKNYLSMMSFSRDSLIEQLLYEGFTQEQAEYGAAAAGY